MRKDVKILAALLLAFGCVAPTVSVLGEDLMQSASEAGSREAAVVYEEMSSYTVTIPKTIVLSGENNSKSADFQVKVQGNLGENEYVLVQPVENFIMSNIRGIGYQNATVEQEQTTFSATEIQAEDGAVASGRVSAKLGVGKWIGALKFTIGVQESSPEPGLYQADGAFVPWQSLVTGYGMNVEKDYSDDETSDSYYQTCQSSPGYLWKQNGWSGKLIIPEEITKIGARAFAGCDIECLVLPDSVKILGDYAFWDCSHLVSIRLPSQIDRLAEGLFWNCSSLTEITIPDQVTRIGAKALQNSGLVEVVIPEGVTFIGDHAFAECAQLHTALLPSTLQKIDELGFAGTALSDVRLPEGFQNLGYGVFSECVNLSMVELPRSLTRIEAKAFCQDSKLTSMELPDDINYLGSSAFAGCTELRSITYQGISYSEKQALEAVLSQNGVTINRGYSWTQNLNLNEETFHNMGLN